MICKSLLFINLKEQQDQNGPINLLYQQLPEEFRKKYFAPHERCLLFLIFELQIVDFINSDKVDDAEFENVFGVTKNRYFSDEAINEWTEQIDLL